MRRTKLWWPLLALVAAAALAACGCSKNTRVEPSAVIGKPAPDFKLSDSNGRVRTLSENAGKIVVLEWLNHDCPFVKKHYESGNMQALQRKYTADGVVWFSVNSSAPGKQGHLTPDEANRKIGATGAAPTAVLLDHDGKVGRLYGAKVTPHMYVVAPNGVLVYNGAIDDKKSTDVDDVPGAHNYVVAALDALKVGKPVEVTQTQPYGCGVKYE